MKIRQLIESPQTNSQTIQQYLNQAGLPFWDADDVIKLYKQCSDSVDAILENGIESNNGSTLFRAMTRGEAGLTKFDPNAYYKDKARQSLSKDNTLLNFISSGEIPGWTQYPSRLKSIFMVNSREHASDFGEWIYVCFPVNGAKLGITRPAVPDFNDVAAWSFKGLTSGKYLANLRFFSTIDRYLTKKLPKDPQADQFHKFVVMGEITWEMVRWLDRMLTKNGITITELLDFYSDVLQEPTLHSSMVSKYTDVNSGIVEMFKGILEPQKNQFSLIQPAQLSSIRGSSREVWTQNVTYAVLLNEIEPIIDTIRAAKKEGLI